MDGRLYEITSEICITILNIRIFDLMTLTSMGSKMYIAFGYRT